MDVRKQKQIEHENRKVYKLHILTFCNELLVNQKYIYFNIFCT